jgi:DNA-binding response OmpR family regulator
VEDSALQRDATRDLLKLEDDFDVVDFKDGRFCVAYLEKEGTRKPSLFLLDEVLLTTTGSQLAGDLRYKYGYLKTPIVIYSAKIMTGKKDEKDFGKDKLIFLKGMAAHDLVARIRSAILESETSA